jgi:catechol 2,3-dioxygenase-like lactoylglutathione lyase family enzyme
MPGLVPGIHVLGHAGNKGVDGRDKPGHDGKREANDMIDHVSIAVRDLAAGARFYQPLLATLGMTKVREWPDAAIGYGKKYPEFWINKRAAMAPVASDSGVHICLRAPSTAAVDAFHAAALAAGGASDGAPGFRAEYHDSYYAAFIRDPDGNRIEAVTFVTK